MVRFQVRWMKKRYKKTREYCYRRYFLSFPSNLNGKIEPHRAEDFEIVKFEHETTKEKEVINIVLLRKEPPKQTTV